MEVQLVPNITSLIHRILFVVYSTDGGTACTEYNQFYSYNIVYSVQYRWRYSLYLT